MYGNKKHLRFIKQFWIQKQFLFNNWNYAFFIHHKKKDNQRHFYCAIISKAAPTGLPVFVSVFVSTYFIPLIWLTQCSCSCVNSNRKHLSVPTIAFCRSFGFFGALLIYCKGILFWFLIHQVIIAICFWEYIFSKNWGLRLSWFFKITCLLWAKEERTVFFSFLFFLFILYPSSPSSI